MISINDLDYNNNFYKEKIKKYNLSAQGVGWLNKDTQYNRFKQITYFINNIEKSNILDVGCGFAEYYNYLIINNKLPLSYTGIDCYDKMIDISKYRFKNLNLKVQNIITDDLQIYDYYICSGAMSLYDKNMVYLFIKKCFLHSNKAFVFNYLKKNNNSKLSMSDIISYCKTFNCSINVINGYLDNDYTICMSKD